MTGIAAASRGAVAITIAMVAVSGCGGTIHAKASTADTRTAHLVPAFRAGQYCEPSQDARYRAGGFVCERHHLARR